MGRVLVPGCKESGWKLLGGQVTAAPSLAGVTREPTLSFAGHMHSDRWGLGIIPAQTLWALCSSHCQLLCCLCGALPLRLRILGTGHKQQLLKPWSPGLVTQPPAQATSLLGTLPGPWQSQSCPCLWPS